MGNLFLISFKSYQMKYLALIALVSASGNEQLAADAAAKLKQAMDLLKQIENGGFAVRVQFNGHVAACHKTLRSKVEAIEADGERLLHDGNKRMLRKMKGDDEYFFGQYRLPAGSTVPYKRAGDVIYKQTSRLYDIFDNMEQDRSVEDGHYNATAAEWAEYKRIIAWLGDITHRYRGQPEQEKIANQMADTMDFFWQLNDVCSFDVPADKGVSGMFEDE